MNENSIKWIALNGMELSPINLSLPEKLNKFGYVVDFDEFGENKAVKAQLCIFDVLQSKEKSNILIICPQRFMQSWYSSLLLGLGVDFKYVIPFVDSIMFFSKEMSNFYIMGEDALKSEVRNPVLEQIVKSDIAWDLMIIDASSSCEGMDVSLYTDNISSKTDKLVIFAPYPPSDGNSDVRSIVKKVLLDEDKSKGIDFFTVDSTVLEFSLGTPFMKYPSQVRPKRKIRTISYSYDAKMLEKCPRIDESQIPTERGGNFFDEYCPEERGIFLKPSYKKPDADALRAVDKKLDEFMKLVGEVMDDASKTALIYFDSDETLDYVYKTLIAVYPEKKPLFSVLNSSVFEVGKVIGRYVADGNSNAPKLILATDYLDESCAVYTPLTYIINYELPANPSVLQQRFMRRGAAAAGDEAEFIIFLDDNGIFDRRLFEKVLCGNLYKAFNHSVPSENVLFSVPDIDNMITNTLSDLKYISDYTGSVGSSFDVITRFKSDYNIPESRNLTTAARTHEYAKRKLASFSAAFGLGSILLEKDVNRDALRSVILEKVSLIRDGYSVFDDANELKAVGRNLVRNGHFEAFANDIKTNVYVSGLTEARRTLDSMLADGSDFPYVKNDVNSLSDGLRGAVLYNIWSYYNNKGIRKSYKEFIKAYNEGVI